MEVNLAVMVMAFGVLGLVALYSLGYRESSQSREDVEASALADKNLNALAAMLSDTNMTWTAWKKIPTADNAMKWCAKGGANGYYNVEQTDDSISSTGTTNGKAQQVFAKIKSACSGMTGSDASFDPGHLQCGLVAYRKGPVCSLAFRAARRAGSLVFQPLFYTEVYFQGDPDK